jgi:hypothetical protein
VFIKLLVGVSNDFTIAQETLDDGKHDYLKLVDWVIHSNTPDFIRVGLQDFPLHWGGPVKNDELVRLARLQLEQYGVPLIRTSKSADFSALAKRTAGTA